MQQVTLDILLAAIPPATLKQMQKMGMFPMKQHCATIENKGFNEIIKNKNHETFDTTAFCADEFFTKKRNTA